MIKGQDLQGLREQGVTDEVVASFANASSGRLRELMTSLVKHLHAFARDVRLTEDEWNFAVDYLTATGEICTGQRQEFILLSDVLGLSMLTVGINTPADGEATESTVFGPFFVHGSPEVELGGDIAESVAGMACYISGVIRGTDGQPVKGARVEVWEADNDGFYDVQYEGGELRGRAHLFPDQEGRYDFWSVRPAAYPIPADGPVGQLLAATGRSPMRPAHVHFMVTAQGYRTLITHIFVAGGEHLESDAVFGVKNSLVIDFQPREAGRGPRGRLLEESWVEAEFDIVLSRLDGP